jgi:hypothetical protein
MTRPTVNAADGISRIFRGLKTGAAFSINPSPLIPKVGKTQKMTITGRN